MVRRKAEILGCLQEWGNTRRHAARAGCDAKPDRPRAIGLGNAVNAAPFDTHAAVKALREAGADERMAPVCGDVGSILETAAAMAA